MRRLISSVKECWVTLICAAGVADMEAEGYGTPDEDQHANVTPTKMTINDMKDWLTEHGHEEKVWNLTQTKAKKQK